MDVPEDDVVVCKAVIDEAMRENEGRPSRTKLKALLRNQQFEQIVRKRGWPDECRADMWMLSSGAHEQMMDTPGTQRPPVALHLPL